MKNAIRLPLVALLTLPLMADFCGEPDGPTPPPETASLSGTWDMTFNEVNRRGSAVLELNSSGDGEYFDLDLRVTSRFCAHGDVAGNLVGDNYSFTLPCEGTIFAFSGVLDGDRVTNNAGLTLIRR